MGVKEQLNYEFRAGFHDSDDIVTVPAGGMISPSVNVTYNKRGKPVSLKDALLAVTSADDKGGSRAFTIDSNLVGLMGLDNSTKKAVGNMVQGVGRSLWFVGNAIGDANAVRVLEDLDTLTSIGSLSSTPQYAKYNGSGWDTPVQVGLAPQDTAPELILSTTPTGNFAGLITGSVSARVARKRHGSVSIASGSSNVVTGDADSVYITIPDYASDGSSIADQSWLLYLTQTGYGSQLTHQLFPLEIPEAALDGSDPVNYPVGYEANTGTARWRVISQHVSSQADRKIEVEFKNNDLLLLSPYEDFYAAEPCKYIMPLGNVMCLIGVGDDSTGFDVSYPNNREAFPPDWRDWFTEVPVSIASQAEKGFFWVLGSNSVNMCRWTGATQESAPVIIDQVSAKYGAIGEAASVSVNGVLYFLSKGGTPVRVDPNKNIDIEYGSQVRNTLAAFDSTTQLGYDESTDSVVFICGKNAITYSIQHGVWGAPFTSGLTVDSFDSCFSYNGGLYLGADNGSGYSTYQWNSNTTGVNWKMVSPFQSGESGLKLKDIIEARVITESETQPYTIVLAAMKNFTTAVSYPLFSHTKNVTLVSISTVRYVESLDYDCVAAVVSGSKGGQTVHGVMLTVEVHDIERVQ